MDVHLWFWAHISILPLIIYTDCLMQIGSRSPGLFDPAVRVPVEAGQMLAIDSTVFRRVGDIARMDPA